MLFGVIVPQVRPEGTVSVRLMIPAKWFMALVVMVVDVEEPALIGTGEDAAIPKSCTWKTGETV